MSRFPIAFRNSSCIRICRRFVHETNRGIDNPGKDPHVFGIGQTHSTKNFYDSHLKSDRVGRGATETTGYKPSRIQKYFLVVTRLYKNKVEIPDYVPAQTWQRFHDRIRAMIVVVISITLTTYFLGMRDRTDRKIVQDRAKLAA